MAVSLNSSNNKNSWIPKEISTGSLGVIISATSSAAMEIFRYDCIKASPHLITFIIFGSYTMSVAGAIIAVSSSVNLCKKIITKENNLLRATYAIALGVLSTSSAGLLGEHFDGISRYSYELDIHSKAYYIGTHFAWAACLVIGIAGLAFTAYAAYRVSKAALADAN